MPEKTLSQTPVFVLGITQRSGTNFLSDLLCLHPDCSSPAPVREDFLLHYADGLMRYSDNINSRWLPDWGIDPTHKHALCEAIGTGLLKFLESHTKNKRLITKTPSVRNLELFGRFFPNATLLILVRDGRAVVESSVKSFGISEEIVMRQWANAATAILDLELSDAGEKPEYLIVKYEDLYDNLRAELVRIFDFLRLDHLSYDFKAAADIPVRGSSENRNVDGRVNWEPIDKTANFKPTQRWSHWKRSTHERFNWIAGKHLERLGYEKQKYSKFRLLYRVRNHLLDVYWLFRIIVKRVRKGLNRSRLDR